jgi:hypothetical protein
VNEKFTCGLCGKYTDEQKWPVCKKRKYIVNCCRECWEKNNEELFNEFIEYYKKETMRLVN